jgi:hypothetical protein
MGIPDGYVIGLGRDLPHEQTKRAHLYKGTHADPGDPMCARGWNRDDGTAYSIWRGQVGQHGICRVCLRRAHEGRDPIPAKPEAEG